MQIQAMLWKTGHAKGRSLTMEQGGWKQKVNKVSMAEVLSIQEWI
jgi:hypothetical protein